MTSVQGTRAVLRSVVLLMAALCTAGPAAAKPFYKNKTIRLVTAEAGNIYDAVARLVARHLPAHIEGNPLVVVQNTPGASVKIPLYLAVLIGGDKMIVLRRLRLLCAVIAISAALYGVTGAMADDVEDFYRGKTLTVLVGGEAGGAYDVYARLLATHIGAYIPGNPKLIMQYMPGAGSVIAANFLYNGAPQDGTIILAPNRTVGLAPVMGQPGARFDPTHVNWLGSLNNEVGVMQVWGTNPVKTIADARSRQVIIGTTSPLTDDEEYPTLLNNTLGTQFRLVRGYESIAAIQNALERGEIQGQENSYFGMKQHFPDWRGKMTVLMQLSLTKHPAMPDIPLVFDFIKPDTIVKGETVDEVETFWRTILSQQVMGRPFALGPKVPPDRVAALRAAFKAMTEDLQFKADAAKSNLELFPMQGDDIQHMIAAVAAVPQATIARLREAIVYKDQ